MEEKTEKPTPKRIRDARKKGQVLKSAELSRAVAFMLLLALISTMLPWAWSRLERLFTMTWSHATLANTERYWAGITADVLMDILLLTMVLPLFVATIIVLMGFAQVRGLFSGQPIAPDFKRIDPAQGFMKLFSSNNMFGLLKKMFIVSLIGGIAGWTIVDKSGTVLRMAYIAPVEAMHGGARIIGLMFVFASVGFLFLAAVDYGHMYYEYMKQLRMSKDEVKREHKDVEGDPHIKGERRRLAREMANSPPGLATKSASVVVVNPTHFAVSLFYLPGEVDLPMVVEKGVDHVALHLRKVASEAGVPVIEYPVLARELYATTAVWEFIPAELFPAVSEVLAWARNLAGDAPPPP